MKLISRLLIVGTLTVAYSATAADFTTLDTDKDGFISQSEAAQSASIRKAFELLDTNKDGKLSEKEFHQ
ncbi:hypothetical protein PCIT_b0138 [Pseudoalteromonas citrea]|uniref:EF-hand domain-containing protein n=2 Tax=Pseudoalteromonas citrea TaxID=43655 RepID=A0AAD4FPI8_9GAMM|nr:EF-hand domain-containing protein [Pseudoalteromonas citrea]KAF7764205.1 hypothetical protein PCIT_b0138 [Pseudoalteromonas citrea]